MADLYLLVENATSIVRHVSVGRGELPSHTTYPMPAGLAVGVDWHRSAGGVYSAPVISDAASQSDAERIAALEERLAALTPPATSEGAA